MKQGTRVNSPSDVVLKYLYEDEGLSDVEIGNRFNVTGMTVCRWRRAAGIETIPDIERRRIRGGCPHLDLNETTLRRLYVDEGLGMDEIGRRYGCSKVPIQGLIRKFGIPVTAKGWGKKGLPDEIPTDLVPLVIGTLLGDACIAYDGGSGTARYKVSHGYSQFSYISAIHRRFGAWAKTLSGSDIIDQFNRRRIGHSFYSVAHPAFRQMRQSWYRDDLRGEFPTTWLKCPPRTVLETLSDESLAYWYFDDGSHGFSIATFFPLIPPEEIAHLVSVGTGLRWYAKNARDGEMFSLSLRAADHGEFQERILPWATPDMAHKFDRSFWPRIRGVPEVPPEVGSKDAERLAFYTIPAWQNQDAGVKAQWVREVFEIHRHHGFPFPRETPPNGIRRIFANLKLRQEPVEDGHVFSRSRAGLSICESFAPHRYDTARRVFGDDASLVRLIETQFQSPAITHVTRVAIRTALGGIGRAFRPAVAKSLVDAFCPDKGTVWIPTAEHGGCLLGAVASDHVGHVVCHDGDARNVEGIRRVWASVSAAVGLEPTLVEITTKRPSNSSVDLILVLSEVRLDSLWAALRTGGYVAFHTRAEDAVVLDESAQAVGFQRAGRFWYPVEKVGQGDEVILVYVKGGPDRTSVWDITERRTTGLRIRPYLRL